MVSSAPPASYPSRRRAQGPRQPAVLARKPTASTSLATCRLVRGTWISGGDRDPRPGSPRFRVLGEMVAPQNWVRRWQGPRLLGHEGREVGDPESVLKSAPHPRDYQCQICHSRLCYRERLLHQAWRPGAFSLLSLLPPPSRLSSGPSAGLSEDLRNVCLEVSICPQPAAPYVPVN